MTRKEKQIAINNEIERFFDKVYNEKLRSGGWSRVDSCTAWIENGEHYAVLKSYNTEIAILDKSTGVMYDVLRWVYGYTATSAKHIAKFRNRFRSEIVSEFTWRAV